jgi:ketosteroid isomerase-like protein
MSRENVEIVQAAFQAYESGDMEGVLRLCDEHVEITQAVELPGVARHQYGHAGVLEAFALWPEQWDDFRVDILRISDTGDQVIVSTLNRGRGKASGVQVETPFSFLFSIRAGKITEWRIFMREEEALAAVGLRE